MKSLLQKLGIGGFPTPPYINRTDRMVEWIWNWCQSDTINQKLDILLQRSAGAPVVSVQIALPRFYSKEGLPMAVALTLPDDQRANVPLVFKDAIGVIHAPPSGGSVNSDNTAVATATVADDDASIDIVSVADGTCKVTYTNGSVSDTVDVTVATPAPTSVEIDSAHATFTPR